MTDWDLLSNLAKNSLKILFKKLANVSTFCVITYVIKQKP